jgi:hypothetical protein
VVIVCAPLTIVTDDPPLGDGEGVVGVELLLLPHAAAVNARMMAALKRESI